MQEVVGGKTKEELGTEEKRLAKAIESTSKGSWDQPVQHEVRNYRPDMTLEEEMALLRKKRKETEDKLIREGKLKPRNQH